MNRLHALKCRYISWNLNWVCRPSSVTTNKLSYQIQPAIISRKIQTMAGQPEIPKMQYAQVFEKCGGPIEYKQIPVPEPGPDEVLVNIKYSGVCHTDLHVRRPKLEKYLFLYLGTNQVHFRLGKAIGLSG